MHIENVSLLRDEWGSNGLLNQSLSLKDAARKGSRSHTIQRQSRSSGKGKGSQGMEGFMFGAVPKQRSTGPGKESSSWDGVRVPGRKEKQKVRCCGTAPYRKVGQESHGSPF